jgi:hypothetical protein
MRPIDIPPTDLRNRPIRVIANADGVTAYGWGGRSASVPRAEIGGVGAYLNVEKGARGGSWTFSSTLVLDTEGRVLLRVTGRWKPGVANAFARRAGLPGWSESNKASRNRKQARRKAPGCRRIRARSRLIGLWYALLYFLFFIPPIVLDIQFGDAWGWAAGLGGLAGGFLFWYLVAFRLPRLTRWLFRRWPVAEPEKTGTNSGGSATV